jgi:LEA14-like dessication related protein
VDKEVLLHIIDGPGATWGWIAFGFFATVVTLTAIRWAWGFDRAIAEGRAIERREGLDQIKAQMAKVVFDQQQIMSKLEFREPAE